MSKRVMVGIPMALATLLLLWCDHRYLQHPWGLWTLYVVGLTAGMREYLRLHEHGGDRLPVPMVCGMTALLCIAHVLELWQGRPLGPGASSLPELVLVGFMILFMSAEVVRGDPARFRLISILFLGFFYIFVLGHYSMRIRHLPRIGEAAFLWWIVVSKSTDAMAYFTGRSVGRHKLVPKVSPGKTIEGAIGGLVFGGAIGLVVWHFTNLHEELPLAVFIPLSLVVQVMGQFGDLVESLMKRSVAVKDSSKMLPGLGGVLDVIDCLLVAAPVAYYGIPLAIRLKTHF